MRLQYVHESSWPALAWLAECEEGYVRVRHGARVETRDDWFAEAVWDGPFADGGFDRTDIVAGSGGRLRDGGLTFVSAGSTLDRLQSIIVPPGNGPAAGNGPAGPRVLVSNSLACLMAAAGATVDPYYRHYRGDFATIIKGLGHHKDTLATSLGPVRLQYFHNLRWDGAALRHLDKPDPRRDFSTFEAYRGFLAGTMKAVVANARDGARRHAMGLIGTLSSGYDSSTVATLAAAEGLKKVIAFDKASWGDPDSGEVAARVLGLECVTVPQAAWREHPLPEVPFMAADGNGEDRFFLAAQDHLRGNLLLTGYHGDKVWGKAPYGDESRLPHPEVKRGDNSGLPHTEFRLSTGYVNCPVPFWGARQIHEVVALSNAPSLAAWDVPGDYSRPVCRRIVEEAGVPRGAFGVAKRAGSVLERALVRQSVPDFLNWCAARGIGGHARDKAARYLIRKLPGKLRKRVREEYEKVPSIRDHFFAWAMDRQCERYRPGPAVKARGTVRAGREVDASHEADELAASPA